MPIRYIHCSSCGKDAPGRICYECKQPICFECDSTGHDCEA